MLTILDWSGLEAGAGWREPQVVGCEQGHLTGVTLGGGSGGD